MKASAAKLLPPVAEVLPLQDTEHLRNKLLVLWSRFEQGKLDVQAARIHIGFARVTLDSLKVEIAGAHLGPEPSTIKPLSFQHEPKE